MESAPQVKVLIVDDSKAFRRIAKAVVESVEPFAVVGEAESGELAITLTSRLDPDLILMDLNLPGIDGLETTKRILTGDRMRMVLLMSTDEESKVGRALGESGAAAFFNKADLSPELLAALWSGRKA